MSRTGVRGLPAIPVRSFLAVFLQMLQARAPACSVCEKTATKLQGALSGPLSQLSRSFLRLALPFALFLQLSYTFPAVPLAPFLQFSCTRSQFACSFLALFLQRNHNNIYLVISNICMPLAIITVAHIKIIALPCPCS